MSEGGREGDAAIESVLICNTFLRFHYYSVLSVFTCFSNLANNQLLALNLLYTLALLQCITHTTEPANHSPHTQYNYIASQAHLE